MQKLLSLYNIRAVRFTDSDNTDRVYAFTSKMLRENIFIEYFYVDPENDGIDEDGDPEYGGHLSVIMKRQDKNYQFLMYHGAFEVGTPVMLLQTILFIIKTIDGTSPDKLVEYFTNMASDPLIPHQIAEKKFRDAANEMIEIKLKTILDLIQLDNAERN